MNWEKTDGLNIILFMAKKNYKTGTSIEIVGLESQLSCLKQETRRFLRRIVLFKVGIKSAIAR